MSESNKKEIPGPKGSPIVNHLFEYQKNPAEFMLKNHAEYGEIFKYSMVNHNVVMISNPAHVRHVLQDNARNYVKSKRYEELKVILGNGLLVSEKEEWSWRRKMGEMAFGDKSLEGYLLPTIDATALLEKRWEKRKADGRAFDLFLDMNELALDITGRTMFGRGFYEFAGVTSHLLSDVQKLFEKRINGFPIPLWVPTSSNLKLKKKVKKLKKIVREIIEDGRSSYDRGIKQGNLLHLFFDYEGSAVNDYNWNIYDEAMTYFLAGHETSGSSFTWIWYLLAENPDVAKRLCDELNQVLGDRSPGWDDLLKLPYTKAVILESLRLYPSIWLFGRLALDDDEFDGYEIPKGTNIFISPYLSHHSSKYWDEPEKFRPERFLPEKLKQIDPYIYIPFGAGARNCVGESFAIQMLMVVVSILARKFTPKLASGSKFDVVTSVTMRPKKGILVTL